MNKYILLIIFIAITMLLIAAVMFDVIPAVIWSGVEFANPTYFRELRIEWAHKPSDFLLRKLHSTNSMRFGIAANILAKRKETKAVNILIKKIRSHFIDSQIHFSSCSALAQISPVVAKDILMEVVEKYRSLKSSKISDYDAPAYRRYKNALQILAKMKDERIYSICLEMAKSDDFQQREFALDGALYNFDNHGEKLLPLYITYLNSGESFKGQVIKEIKGLKRPEAISALEEFALKNKDYAKDAREAIEYLKSLQKQ